MYGHGSFPMGWRIRHREMGVYLCHKWEKSSISPLYYPSSVSRVFVFRSELHLSPAFSSTFILFSPITVKIVIGLVPNPFFPTLPCSNMTSLNLVPRAGQMILNFGISSSGDDARTVDIPFGTLATEGGSIAIPKALKISIESSSGIPISGSDVVCQAFKDAQGTQVLGKSFTQSGASTLGPEPVTIGSIFCSDAKSVEAQIGGNDASAQTTSAGSDVATTTEAVQSSQAQSSQTQTIQHQSIQAQTQTQIIIAPTTSTSDTFTPATTTTSATSSSVSRLQQTTPSPSPAIDPSANGGKPKTIQQTSSIMMDTGSAPSLQSTAASTGTASVVAKPSTLLSSATSVANTQGAVSSSSPAAAQTTSAAYSVHTQEVWTVRRLANLSILAACYIGWFIL